MAISVSQYIEMERRLSGNRNQPPPSSSTPVEKEIPLHDDIIKHCNSQWPVWKFRHARTDRKTTEEIGVEDFTMFLPGGKTLHVEVKAKDKKQTAEQLSWSKQLEMLGHTVHVVRSMEEFMKLVKETQWSGECIQLSGAESPQLPNKI